MAAAFRLAFRASASSLSHPLWSPPLRSQRVKVSCLFCLFVSTTSHVITSRSKVVLCSSAAIAHRVSTPLDRVRSMIDWHFPPCLVASSVLFISSEWASIRSSQNVALTRFFALPFHLALWEFICPAITTLPCVNDMIRSQSACWHGLVPFSLLFPWS